MDTRMMLDGDLCNAKSARRSENWDEAMHFSVKRNLIQDLAAIGLKTTIKVMQMKSSKLPENSIEYK